MMKRLSVLFVTIALVALGATGAGAITSFFAVTETGGDPTWGPGATGAPDFDAQSGVHTGKYTQLWYATAYDTMTVTFEDYCMATGTSDVRVLEAGAVDDYTVWVDGVQATAGTPATYDTGTNGTDGTRTDFDVTGVMWFKTLTIKAVSNDVEIDAVRCFTMADEYLIADASIDQALDAYAPDTAKPDFSVSGVMGIDTDGDEFGTLELRYHADKITCWVDVSTGDWRVGDTGFDADLILDYAGVDNADYTCNNGDAGTFASVFFLDPATTGVPGWPGGAVVVDEDGDRETSDDYDLIGELASSYYWVPLDRGEVTFYVW